jgi:hypothetical protein
MEEDFVDVDDFERFKSQTPLPSVEIRSTRAMPSVRQHASVLSMLDVKCKISDYKISSKSIFKKQVVSYTLTTEVTGQLLKFHVQRTDEDFTALRKFLLQEFPYMLAPPLPPKRLLTDDKKVPKRAFLYQRFINAVLKCEVFKCSQTVVAFFKAANRNDWDQQVFRAESDRSFRILCLNGEIDVRQTKYSEKFAKRIPDVIQEYEKRTQLTA